MLVRESSWFLYETHGTIRSLAVVPSTPFW
jgi:hypothetical protein